MGSRSLLFGVHQLYWHPLTVAVAWRSIYGRWPTWREAFCILIHDLGYVGCATMDGEHDGERHPELGARIASGLLGREWGLFVLLHSRHYARRVNRSPSPLCWADKFSILYEPWWLYLPRACATGELAQYRSSAAGAGAVTADKSHREWFAFIQAYFREQALSRRVGSFLNPRVSR